MREIKIMVEDIVYEQLVDMAKAFGTSAEGEAERFFMEGFEERKLKFCPLCNEEIHSLNVEYPPQTGSYDLDCECEEDPSEALTMDVERLHSLVTCPECCGVIPDATLKNWGVSIDDK